MNDIEKILIAEKKSKEAKKSYDDMVAKYIENNVDPTNWASMDDAILSLPESKNKLFLYDMMYDFQENKKEQENKGTIC